jgi:hypothetical protein
MTERAGLYARGVILTEQACISLSIFSTSARKFNPVSGSWGNELLSARLNFQRRNFKQNHGCRTGITGQPNFGRQRKAFNKQRSCQTLMQ